MPKSDFVYGNFDTAGLAWCYKLQPIHFPTPERDIIATPIPGRDGDIIEDNGNFKNVTVTVELAIEAAGQKDFLEYFDILKNAIESQPGYQRIEDSLYPDEYCFGYVTKIERDQSDTVNGKVVLTIECKPQRFLKSGGVVSYELSSNTAPNFIVAEGTMKDVMSAQYVSLMGLTTPNEVVTVLDVDGMYQTSFIDDTYKLYAYYPKDAIGGRFVWGDSDKDPTTSAYTGGGAARGLLKSEVWSYSLSERYIYFKTPLYWRIVNETQGIEVASLFTAQRTIASPTRFPAKPLIKIATTGTAVTGQAVAYINGEVIRLNITPTIYVYGEAITVDNIFIDCETMDAFMIVNDAPISLNKYVKLPDKTITIDNGAVVMCNGFIDSLTITPRWWNI